MSVPTFTAEATTYASSQHYRSAALTSAGSAALLSLRNNCAEIWDSLAGEAIPI